MKQFPSQSEIFKDTGLPAIFFDGDHTDPGVFSLAQFETKLQALCEMMADRKGAGK
jgi:benzoyl-CoA reductase/2-hydroxyglutaryl-CoA dehydratase subunit BcrC/BadD/HgdB